MRRSYFLASNSEISEKIVDGLLLARIEMRHLRKRHPDAECGGTEPRIPTFP